MAGAPIKAADPEWVHILKQEGPFPFADSLLCSNAWASPPGHNFFVRGPHYLETMAKVPATEPLLQLIAFDLIKSSSKICNVMDHPQCRVRIALRAARDSAKPSATTDGVTDGDGVLKPFVWAFNLQLPSRENHSLVMYYVSFHSPEKGSLLQRFLDGDDAFRSERLKLLTNIPQGPRIVKLVKKERGPGCLIGKVLDCRYKREKEYMEVDVDLGSSMISRAAFQICSRFSTLVTVEFAFVMEGRYESELPERIVGAIRLANLDFSCATSLDCTLLRQEPMSEDNQKASYGGLWKSLGMHAQASKLPEKNVLDEEKLCDGISKKILFP